ncbi:MAG: phosphoglycerate kinase [bacterium]|nr:phosphoglycerate kinase [bacterium]
MSTIHWIDEQNDLAGKCVLVRAEFNVPVQNGRVLDDFRIKKTLPTILYLKERGARVILISHIGREPSDTLAPVAEALNKHLPVAFRRRENANTDALRDGEVILLENLRQDPREMANDYGFANELALLADLFVQDAFGTCHRAHASFVGIPKFLPSFGGMLVRQEVEALSRAREPEHPSLFVLGGAKVETKEPLSRKFLGVYDKVFVGGALANDLLAAQGFPIGASKIEDGKVPREILHHPNLLAIDDVVVLHPDASTNTVHPKDVSAGDVIVDIGQKSVERLTAALTECRTVLWNGPLGWYEKGFSDATRELARAITTGKADDGVCLTHAIIGGGDTIAAIGKPIEGSCSFVSTGGGAMLEFLLKGTLPGIKALEQS